MRSFTFVGPFPFVSVWLFYTYRLYRAINYHTGALYPREKVAYGLSIDTDLDDSEWP